MGVCRNGVAIRLTVCNVKFGEFVFFGNFFYIIRREKRIWEDKSWHQKEQKNYTSSF